MNWFRKLFGLKPIAVEAQQVATPELSFKGQTLIEQALGRVQSHDNLGPLLNDLRPVANQQARGFFSKSLKIKDMNEHRTPYELFRGLVNMSSSLPDSTLRAWVLTATLLGTGPNLLFVLVDHPAVPMALVCCKLADGGYLGSYQDPDLVMKPLGL